MDSSLFFGITTFAYLFASVFYIALFVFKNRTLGHIGTALTVVGTLTLAIALGLRWQESYQIGIGHAPLTNMYESLVFFAWCIGVFYLFMEFKYKNKVIGAFVMPIAFASMAYASLSSRVNEQISPLVPALQSNWLIAHVVTCFIGYGAFAMAAGLGIMYLLKKSAMNKKGSEKTLLGSLPDLRFIDDMTYKTIVFGFLWLSAGIITGAIWANEAWGTYWSWDPKETWSIITWFIYASTLHARFTRGWSGSRIAWLAIIGFASVFFTYFGVNYVLSGLHSYGSN